jgi:hypothetical protein
MKSLLFIELLVLLGSLPFLLLAGASRARQLIHSRRQEGTEGESVHLFAKEPQGTPPLPAHLAAEDEATPSSSLPEPSLAPTMSRAPATRRNPPEGGPVSEPTPRTPTVEAVRVPYNPDYDPPPNFDRSDPGYQMFLRDPDDYDRDFHRAYFQVFRQDYGCTPDEQWWAFHDDPEAFPPDEFPHLYDRAEAQAPYFGPYLEKARPKREPQQEAAPEDQPEPEQTQVPAYGSGLWYEYRDYSRARRIAGAEGRALLRSAIAPLPDLYAFEDVLTKKAGAIDQLVVSPRGVFAFVAIADEGLVFDSATDGRIYIAPDYRPELSDDHTLWDGVPFPEEPHEMTEDLATEVALTTKLDVTAYAVFTNATLNVSPTARALSVLNVPTLVSAPDDQDDHELPSWVEAAALRIEHAFGRKPWLTPYDDDADTDAAGGGRR